MCGIVMLSGPQAQARVRGCIERLKHRGPDDQNVWAEDETALGFTRLAINGAGEQGRQPYRHNDFIGAINGEIYNHVALQVAHSLAQSSCDTQVVLPLFEQCGPTVIDELDGFYAGVIFNRSTREVFCLRDRIGKKPLFVGRSGSEIFIASELKVFSQIDWFQPLPLGTSTVDLRTGGAVQVTKHHAVIAEHGVVDLFAAAVRKRMPAADQPVGVFLSGGLDSSLVAAFVARERSDALYFTLGDPDSPDRQVVEKLVGILGLRRVRYIPLPTQARIADLVHCVVYATESFNPSIVSNGIATYLLAEAARKAGVKVVLTGEGADELFGGYHQFEVSDPWLQMRTQLINDMHLTELRRLDMCSMAHGVEARCPFLDRAILDFSDGLDFDALYNHGENKATLRHSFNGVLPQEVLQRRKISFDVGSGLRGAVVTHLRQHGKSERAALHQIWQQQFAFDSSTAYFHAYPAFDQVIDRRSVTHQ